MMQTIIDIGQWLIPAGSLVTFLGWFTNRTLRQLRTLKEEHDTYKLMYDDLKETVKEILAEDKEIKYQLRLRDAALGKTMMCRYRRKCPVNKIFKEMGQQLPFEIDDVGVNDDGSEPDKPP